MALAVTHILIVIVLLDLFRHYVFKKEKFPRYLLVIGGIAGLLPDIDIPLGWVFSLLTGSTVNFHGTFTHSIFFPVIFLIVGVFLHYKKKMKWAKICYVISAGLIMHTSLDCLFGGYKTFLWPLAVNTGFCPQWGLSNYAQSIDAIILVAWLVHEEIHNRIRDYI